METAQSVAIVCAGLFFLTGLMTGIWKYKQIMASAEGQAHPYVDICHRASLMYAFAAILLAKFVEVSQLPGMVELIAVSAVLVYFASAIVTYFIHGLLQDTDNQLKPPFHVGKMKISSSAIALHMWMLIVAEVAGFLVLFYGVVIAVL
ncbi:MAG: hypothetical protein H6987_08750 [Pseudomonadales bacterium]|nr:hypothetical protein [Pseudomonadales bacterium]